MAITQMHSRGIFDLVWMVRHGRLLHRARGLTRFLGAHFVARQKANAGILPAPASKLPPQRTSSPGTPVLAGDPVRCAQNDNLESSGSWMPGRGRRGMWQVFFD